MKIIKNITAILFLSFISSNAMAQFSLGAHYSSVNFLAGSEVKNKGFGLVGNYGLDVNTRFELVAYAGFSLYSAYELEGTFTATAASNQTNPSSIEVKYTNEIPLTHIYLGAKLFFVGDYDDDNFSLYGLGEMGFMASSYSTTVEDYDNVNYNLTVAEDETISNFMVTLGVGLEKGIGFGHIFGEAKINLTANEENGEAVEVEIPSSTTINLGYRYTF